MKINSMFDLINALMIICLAHFDTITSLIAWNDYVISRLLIVVIKMLVRWIKLLKYGAQTLVSIIILLKKLLICNVFYLK